MPQAVAVTFANAYARASVLDGLCGFSFAATGGADGAPAPLPADAEARLFGVASGIPPTGGVNVVNDLSPDGPRLDRDSRSPSSGRADQNLDGALRLRALQTGRLRGEPLAGEAAVAYLRVQAGVAEVRAGGRLGGVPAILLHGRSDALIAPNHTSRPYYALSRLRDGGASRIRYYEVTNAHHFDAFNGLLPGFDERFVPLHYYLIEALDLMYAHLTEGAALPPSQVVRTTPRGRRGDAVPPLTDGEGGNLPPIRAEPAAAERITFDGTTLSVPD